MRRIIIVVLLLLIIIGGVGSCRKDKRKVLPTYQSFCDSLQVRYSVHIQPIIQSQCATSTCHVPGGAGNGDFTSYSGVKAKVDNGSFEYRVLIQPSMPPPPADPLPDSTKQKIDCWLKAGAPDN